MAREQEDFRKATDAVLKAVIFENWLRFYFIREEDAGDKLLMDIPDKSMFKIKNLYPLYFPLAEDLNKREIDFTTSRNAVCAFVANHLEGNVFPSGTASIILNSQAFQTGMQLFNAWVQMHEDQLDQGFLQFDAWLDLFDQWRNSPGARELAQKLASEA